MTINQSGSVSLIDLASDTLSETLPDVPSD